MCNYAVKLGWQPIFVDLDLTSDETTPPATLSASVINTTLPCDTLHQTVTMFHSAPKIITQELFVKQVEELALAVTGKQQNDLNEFEAMFDGCLEVVAPANPELFASGTIVNGFTPKDKRETDTLLQSIKLFNTKIVLVIDYEKLEKDI